MNVSPLAAVTGVPLALVNGAELVTVNAGARPCTVRSERFWSPSCANALSRIASIRPVSDCGDAIVKFHAS